MCGISLCIMWDVGHKGNLSHFLPYFLAHVAIFLSSVETISHSYPTHIKSRTHLFPRIACFLNSQIGNNGSRLKMSNDFFSNCL